MKACRTGVEFFLKYTGCLFRINRNLALNYLTLNSCQQFTVPLHVLNNHHSFYLGKTSEVGARPFGSRYRIKWGDLPNYILFKDHQIFLDVTQEWVPTESFFLFFKSL